MYLIHKTEGHDKIVAEATERPPFGPGLKQDLSRAATMEVWGTSFKDPGEYTEFRVFDDAGTQIANGRVDGY